MIIIQNNIIISESKINKISMLMSWVAVILGSIVAYTMNNQFIDVLKSFVCGTILFSAPITIFYFIKKDNPLIKYFINFMGYILMFCVIYIQKGEKDNAFALLCPIAYTSIFFDKYLTLFAITSGNALIILLYIFYSKIFFPAYSPSEIVTLCLCMTISGILIFAQAIWGRKTIITARSREMEANNLNEKLVQLFNNIYTTSEILDKSVINISEDTKLAKDEINQITYSVQQTSKTLETQSRNTLASTKSLSKTRDIIARIFTNSEDMTSFSNLAYKVSEDGKIIINDLVQQIHVIKNTVSIASDAILDLSEQSNQINKIAALINQVASQIDLLSLNASIEAARAGEAGKGFAIIAQEIKKLATQTSGSVHEISQILSYITQKVDSVSEHIADGNNAIEQGITISDTSNEYFINISDKVNEIKEKADTIQKDVQYLSLESGTVFKNIESVSDLISEASMCMEETSSSTLNQKEMVTHLNELIQELVNQSKQLKSFVDNVEH